jgi:probable phosphoglycerate mutase
VTLSPDDKAGSALGPAFVVPASVPDGAALWLVRHGETEWSRSGRHTSRTEVGLTATGERQARALRAVLGGLRPALVRCSPRKRARSTARLAGLTVDAVDADLTEWDYGDYEGKTSAEIRAGRPGWSLWHDGVPAGESAAAVTERADRVLRRACENLARGPVVLLGHGHLSRVLGARWIGLPAAGGEGLLLDAAAVCVLSAQYGAAAIQHWNMPAERGTR